MTTTTEAPKRQRKGTIAMIGVAFTALMLLAACDPQPSSSNYPNANQVAVHADAALDLHSKHYKAKPAGCSEASVITRTTKRVSFNRYCFVKNYRGTHQLVQQVSNYERAKPGRIDVSVGTINQAAGQMLDSPYGMWYRKVSYPV